MNGQTLEFDDNGALRAVVGERGGNLRVIEQRAGVTLRLKGNTVTIGGEDAGIALAANVLAQLYGLVRRGYPLYASDVDQACRTLAEDREVDLGDIFLDTVYIASSKRVIAPKSPGQKAYIDAIRAHDIVFGIGPAGTGKTYLAMAMAVAAMTRGNVRRILLARPAVEAGERLGYLPGSLIEKVNPYLRPLYDALHDMMDVERANLLVEKGVVEVAPLAFMRGRTLNDSFVILDEAQNTTCEQMKMFLTRLGFGSKAVVTGDITQIDLPRGTRSGLVHAAEVLAEVPGIAQCTFSDVDVVRHPLVQEIVRAYERHTREQEGEPQAQQAQQQQQRRR